MKETEPLKVLKCEHLQDLCFQLLNGSINVLIRDRKKNKELQMCGKQYLATLKCQQYTPALQLKDAHHFCSYTVSKFDINLCSRYLLITILF